MKQLPMHKSLEPYAKDILIIEMEDDVNRQLPLYADGFPGIVYTISNNKFFQYPRNKQMSNLYLYGQTVEPMTLEIEGPFRLICIRLFPFAMRMLLDIEPKELKDDCYDLRQVECVDTQGVLDSLENANECQEIITILGSFFEQLARNASLNIEQSVSIATNMILKSKGGMSIKEIRRKLNVAERTFERHFLNTIGVTPKQFARIIQFDTAIRQMSDSDYTHLTDIGYESGYADQSHFIRSFKRYTGMTPKEYLSSMNAKE